MIEVMGIRSQLLRMLKALKPFYRYLQKLD